MFSGTYNYRVVISCGVRQSGLLGSFCKNVLRCTPNVVKPNPVNLKAGSPGLRILQLPCLKLLTQITEYFILGDQIIILNISFTLHH